MNWLNAIKIGLLAAVLTPLAPTVAADEDIIRVAAPWEISSPDPATDGFIFLRMGVMETLVETTPAGELKPGLATEWKDTNDGLTWQFELRQAKFHDGSDLSAKAAVTALQRAASKPGPLSKAPVKSIQAKGSAVVFTLSKPFAALPAVLAHSSAVIASPSAFDAEGKAIKAIGTGPFMVSKFSPPQSLNTKRYEDYWGDKAAIAGGQYLASSRAETRALLAESKDADLIFTLDPAGFKQLGNVDHVVTKAVAIPRVMLVKVNAEHPMLKDVEARQALSLAIDRQGIASGITRFPEAGAKQLFPPALADWHNPALPALGYDPEAAKALLTKLGWKAGSDGILERDAKRFSLTIRTFPDRPELPQVATALQDQWRQIGIELKVSVANYSEIPAGHKDGSLELALFARNYGVTADPIGSVLGDFGNGGGDWGAMNWKPSGITETLQQIAATGDAKVRAPKIGSVATAIHNELPLIPVLWYQHTVAYSKKLQNVSIDPLERSYGLDRIRWAK